MKCWTSAAAGALLALSACTESRESGSAAATVPTAVSASAEVPSAAPGAPAPANVDTPGIPDPPGASPGFTGRLRAVSLRCSRPYFAMLAPTQGADTPEALALAVAPLAPAVVAGCRAAEDARAQLTPVTTTDREMTSGCQQAFISAPRLATLWASGAYLNPEADSAMRMLQMTQNFCPGWRRAEATGP